ncbi:MAG: hydrogenase maturation nickel metallochaperone HypA [Christensenellaceae bacterium]|nr:hydrogenase maturation nickel metallochaperone HypA [Christensenellaceae bacterium]
MKSKNLDKIIMLQLVLSLLSSIALPVGVVGTVLCAVNLGSVLSILGMAFFIACILVGFYGTPLLWTSYAKYKGMEKIKRAIIDEKISDTLQLSTHCNTSQKETNRRIAALISGGYLKGYTVDRGYTQIINLAEQSKQQEVKAANNICVVKCSGCGAKYEVSAESRKCPYCGSANVS